MTTISNPQFESLKDVAASAILNVFDAYGWSFFVTLLVVAFFGVIVLLSFLTEFDLFDFDFKAMGDIFRFVRSLWSNRAKA